MVVKIKRLVPEAVMPKKAHSTDAGYDLVAVSRKVDEDGAVVYGFGLAMEIPEGYVGLVFPRSSIAKKDLALSNAVGVVDSCFRGEVLAKFKPILRVSEEREVFVGGEWYEVGDRIAQLVIMKLPDVFMVESDELSESERGVGGYGSSGR